MFDELELGDVLGFVAGDPVAVMEMFTPEGAVVGADAIVVVDDAGFVVGAGQRKAWPV